MRPHDHVKPLADEGLLQNIGQRCSECFEQLFHRYCRQVHSVAYKLLRHNGRAYSHGIPLVQLKCVACEHDLWFPTISLAGSAGLIPFHQDTLPNRYAAAGLNVNIPIFNGRLYSARAAEARLRAEAADQSLRDEADRIARDVRLAWSNAQTGFQRLALTQQLLDHADLAFDLAQQRYKLGLGSIVELSQAQLNQTQAQIEQSSAKYDYQAQIANLNYQIGALH